jgi:hypothetical protein
MVCRCPCIVLNSNVNAIVALNEMQINNVGVKTMNNKSLLFANKIQKCHYEGIVVSNMQKVTMESAPHIFGNYIESSSQNGIIVDGENTNPRIHFNILEANRKCGIKIENYG